LIHRLDLFPTRRSSDLSRGVVRIVKYLDETIEGKDVLIVEDIIDSGRTLSHLIEILKQRHPASIHLCTLMDTGRMSLFQDFNQIDRKSTRLNSSHVSIS